MAERPDPDKLLATVQRAEAKQRSGRLKIFFGACAGVGKTYAMLTEAAEVRARGIDVVVGIVETHRRAETEALLDGLEVLPRKLVEYRGTMLPELDIDAVIARHPQLVLVDELAHSNAPGSRHPKRWQDIKELLALGIDVYTTVNVQHLESLNDVVGQITNVRVAETVPDRVFDEADEVELVDLPTDDLLARLKAGKVYLPEQVAHAVGSFFRKGNLIALRELALRRTADRVDAQAREYRDDEAIRRVWQLKERLIVAVGPGTHSEQLIRAGRRLADTMRADWIAVYVETPALQRLPEAERARVLRALRLAQELGAQTATLSGQNVAATLVEYAAERNAGKIVLGRSSAPLWRRLLQRSTYDAVAELAGTIDLLVVGDDSAGAARRATRDPQADAGQPRPRRVDWRGYLEVFGALALVTSIAPLLRDRIDLTNIVMLYLIVVVWAAVRSGRGPAVVAAIVGVGLFDFVCVPPYYTFAVSDTQYLMTFTVMLIVALTIAQLTAGIRYQGRVATHRERRAAALYALSRELSGALTPAQIGEIAIQHVETVFEASAALLLPGRDEKVGVARRSEREPRIEPDLSVAQWVHDHWQPAGLGTDTLAGTAIHYVPLRAPVRNRGVLALLPRNERLIFVPEQQRLLETFAAQIALALERVHFVEVAQEAELGMASEQLRNSLLASISHDLRTPLAVLAGAASSLAEHGETLSDSARKDLTETIYDQAMHMSELTANVLDMVRLETGKAKVNLQWHPFEEVVGAVLQRMRALLHGRRVDVRVDESRPLVWLDGVLIGRVLANLLDNAIKYTPAGTPIEIRAVSEDARLVVSVSDHGPGLAAGDEERVFDKFYRAHPEGATGGAGLGLAICRAVVEAHRGSIRADNRAEGGARFTFALPQPPLPEGPVPEHAEVAASQ
jgi:two-component system sensor histidine kinase KdpD